MSDLRSTNSERLLDDGLFVVMEGIHGCGKSTQVQILSQKLGEQGLSAVVTKEVSGTPLADTIREVITAEDSEALENPTALTLLVAAARASRVKNVIAPVLKAGGVVISDRYAGSMLVEQHYGQGVDESFIRTLNEHITAGAKPDVTFVLDVDPGEAHARRVARAQSGQAMSFWDSQSSDYHSRSRYAYLGLAETEPDWVVVDGARPLHDIANEIYEHTQLIIDTK